MATMQELEAALIKADAAGNAQDAKVFADAIREMRAQQAPSAASIRADPAIPPTVPDPVTQQNTQPASTPVISTETPIANNPEFSRLPGEDQKPTEPGFFDKGGAVNKFAEGVVRGDVQRGVRNGLGQVGLGLVQLVARGGLTGELARKLQESLGQSSDYDLGAKAGDAIGKYAGERQKAFDATNAGQGSAGKLGSVVGQTAPAFLVPGGQASLPARLGAAAVGGAVMGAAQPVASGDYVSQKAKQVGTAAAANALGQGVIGEPLKLLAGGASNSVSKATKDLYAKAKANNIPIGIPQVSKNGLLRTVADQGARLPGSGGSKRAAFRQEQFNRQVGKTIGVDDAKAITSDVFDSARARIGEQFNSLSARNSLPITPRLLTRLGSIRAEVKQSQGPEIEKAIEYWLNRLTSKAGSNGSISGKAYKTFDSEIGKQAAAAGGEKGLYLGRIREAVRTQMDASISPADQAAWKLARKQWAALKTIEPLIAKSPDGNISPALLMGAVTNSKSTKSMMARGKSGALGDLAKIGQRFMKSAPDSGTADRAAVNAITAAGIGGGYHYAPEAALGVGGALFGNRLLQSGINSKLATDYYVKGAPKLIRKPLEAGARASGPMAGASYLELLREQQGNNANKK